jgi:hypothetical protein
LDALHSSRAASHTLPKQESNAPSACAHNGTQLERNAEEETGALCYNFGDL